MKLHSKNFQIYTISIDDHWSFRMKIPTCRLNTSSTERYL
nr:MAG TPA: hypothetical protein [Caudoviricetes sp.]